MSQSLYSLPHDIPSDIQELLLQQLQSWQQGTRPPIETIVELAKPENRTIAVHVLVKQEIVLREQAGEEPEIDEYLSRFPECAGSLSGEWESQRDATMATDLNGILANLGPSGHDRSFEKTFSDQPEPGSSAFFECNTQTEVPSNSQVDMLSGSHSDSQGNFQGRAQPVSHSGAQPALPIEFSKLGSHSGNPNSNASTGLPRPRESNQSDPFSRMIGMYRLDKKLGQGGMGAVFRAVHTKLDKVVAIKIMSRQGMLDNTAVERFEREMRAVGRIEHPNVVRAMDAGEADGYHYLVMEYVEGQDVSQLVKANGPFSISHACEIIRQAALGLNEAHALGLVHRDIKPSNLFLTTKGVVKILDLGLARLNSHSANLELTQSGLCMGTPDYMAPEQWVSARDVDGRSDFYALGCTLFHLIAGHPPFGTKEHMSLGNKVLAHTSGIVPDIRLLCSGFPEGLKPVLDRMLAKDRSKRFANGIEMAAALEPFCEPLPGAENASTSEVSIVRPNPSGPQSPTARNWMTSLAYWGGGFALFAVAAFITIRITDPNGRVTVVQVPAGSTIEVSPADEERAKSATEKSFVKAAKPADGRAISPGKSAVERSGVAKTGGNNAPELINDPTRKSAASETTLTSLPNEGTKNGQLVGINSKMAKEPGTPMEINPSASPTADVVPTTVVPSEKMPVPTPSKVTIVAINPGGVPTPVVAKVIPAVPLKLPASADAVADQQAAWSRELKRPTTVSNSLEMPFILIPPGDFEMGGFSAVPMNAQEAGGSASQTRAAELPRHHVKLSRPFAMAQHEVTVAQFRQFVNATQYRTLAERETATGSSLSEGLSQKQRLRLPIYSWQFAGDLPIDENQPVTNISWYDALAFCEWLSQKEGLTYRLPSEAEWEYVVRAGNGTIVDGSKEALETLRQQANIGDASSSRAFAEIGIVSQAEAAEWDDAFPAHAPVGQFAANALGLKDFSGNVAEWCGDRFGAEYYKVSPLENPRGPLTGDFRVVRGTSWQSPVVESRPEFRAFAAPGQSQLHVGFRIVQELTPALEVAKTQGPSVEQELAVAEWVLQAGGKVRFSINGTTGNEVSKLTDLPKIARGSTYSLFSVSLAETGISDSSLIRLKPLSGLQELDVSGNPVSDAGLVHLASSRLLKKLNLSRTHVTGAGLIHLTAGKKIAELDLSLCPVSDNSLSPIKVLTTLTALRLDSTAVTDSALELLKPLVLLKELSLVDTRVTGTGLVYLKKLPVLTTLDLSEAPLVDKFLIGLADLKTLRQLRLNWSTVGDMGLEHLRDSYTLLEVELRGTSTADSNIDILQKLKAIKSLDLRETDFSESGVGDLKRALKKATITASIGGVDARVASLCLSLGGKLVVAADSKSEPRSVTQSKDLPHGSFEIREIDLTDVSVSDGVLLMIPKLRALKVLNLSGTRVDDAGIAILAPSQQLESLNLSGTLITEQGLSHLNEIKSLKSLTVRETRLPIDKFTELRANLPNVQIQ